jgi:NAD(P)-dependent dehydrogenase (short-subunit alcohol dehydrogenase family)
MAKYFHERRNTVIICGRSENRLTQATKELQVIHTIKCDVADFGDRKTLFLYVSGNFPNINILINNAGIQRDIDLTKGISDLSCDRKCFIRPCFYGRARDWYAGILRDKGRTARIFDSTTQATRPAYKSGFSR